MRKLIVGEVEVTALTDVEGPFFRLSQLFPGVRADQWGPYLERYPWAFADAETLYGRVGSYLLRSPGHVVLVDTGIGPGAMYDEHREAVAELFSGLSEENQRDLIRVLGQLRDALRREGSSC